MLVVYHFQITNVTLLLQVFYLFYNTVVVNIVGSIFSFRSAVFRVHVSDFLPIISLLYAVCRPSISQSFAL